LLRELSTLSGNDLLFKIHEQKNELENAIATWKALRENLATRMPAFELTRSLQGFATAAQLPEADEEDAALKAIVHQRSLLADPDPVVPIRQKLGSALRAALTAAFEHHEQVLKNEMQAMLRNDVWAALSPEERHGFLHAQGVTQRELPQMGSDESLAAALRASSLGTWRTHADALNTRCQNALAAAIQAAQPKARKVDLPRATINNEAELEAWLADAEKTLSEALKDGPAII